MTFRDSLREIRKARKMTQKDVYTRLQVSPNCYASWEQGRTQPDIENIIRLCKLFNVTADHLLGITDEYGIPY